MKALEERVVKEGVAVGSDILRVDGFLNHQVDINLMQEVAEDFADRFKDAGVTKVVTIESSGIAPALLTAIKLGVPLVIMKKQPSKVVYDHLFTTSVVSFTKETSYELTVSKDYISSEDHVLVIDDFLSNGEAATGAVRLIRMANATVAGLGVMIEKAFMSGREKLEERGIHVYAQCKVAKLDEGKVVLAE